MAAPLREVLEQLGGPRVLVVGDLMLDRYTRGAVERVSQEAPVIVLRAGEQDIRLGGAANVVHMLHALEAEVVCAGVVGRDEAACQLLGLLQELGVDADLVVADAARRTTLKERFVGLAGTRHPSQMLRVDYESREPLPTELEQQILNGLAEKMAGCGAMLISDYAKGVCTPRLTSAVIELARARNIPVLVDPRADGEYEHYRGATLVKANRLETERASGRPIQTGKDALAAGAELCRRYDFAAAVVTLDRDGMALIEPNGCQAVFPTTAREVYDITGAGDMVLAAMGLCLVAGQPLENAVALGNVAAGIEVERSGVAAISRDEIKAAVLAQSQLGGGKIVSLAGAAQVAEASRQQGRRVVFTNGCFDLLHVGHVSYLAEAAAKGDFLIVAVNSDASVQRLKGPTRPIIGEYERAAMLASLQCVGAVVVFSEDTPHALLHAIRPDVLVKGGTYTTEQVVGHAVVEAYGGEVCVTNVVDGFSTTRILESLSQNKNDAEHAPLRRAS